MAARVATLNEAVVAKDRHSCDVTWDEHTPSLHLAVEDFTVEYVLDS